MYPLGQSAEETTSENTPSPSSMVHPHMHSAVRFSLDWPFSSSSSDVLAISFCGQDGASQLTASIGCPWKVDVAIQNVLKIGF